MTNAGNGNAAGGLTLSMQRTVEGMLIWGTLGSGVALSTSGHRHLGFLLAMASLAMVAMTHPRGTKHAILSVPKALGKTGKAVGKAGAKMGKVVHHAA